MVYQITTNKIDNTRRVVDLHAVKVPGVNVLATQLPGPDLYKAMSKLKIEGINPSMGWQDLALRLCVVPTASRAQRSMSEEMSLGGKEYDIARLKAYGAELERTGESIFLEVYAANKCAEIEEKLTRFYAAICKAKSDNRSLFRAREIVGELEQKLDGWQQSFLRAWRPDHREN